MQASYTAQFWRGWWWCRRDYISIILRPRIRKEQAQNYPRCVPLQKTTLSPDMVAQKTSLATKLPTKLPTELPSLILTENNLEHRKQVLQQNCAQNYLKVWSSKVRPNNQNGPRCDNRNNPEPDGFLGLFARWVSCYHPPLCWAGSAWEKVIKL